MPARAVLINADDLGLGSAVDRGILDAWAAGAIGDSSVFATAPDLPAVLRAADAAGLPVGIHFNLTFGQPLGDPATLPALVTPEGAFMRRQAWTQPLPADQIRAELTRQLQRVYDLGWRPSHLDSHHHVHAYPEILTEVILLAQETGLPVRAVSPEMRATLRAAGVATPEHFSMAFYGERATIETLCALVDACPDGVLEIMTHPGYADPELPSSYRAERAHELRALTDPRWHHFRTTRGIPIIGFAGLR